MGRKKEDREAKADHKKARRLAKEAENVEDDSISLAHQLAPLGLQKEILGNSRKHLEYRANTVEYMKHFRADFEPFVEDDVPFDRHTANLRKSGTFAGNDALVALARFLKVSIVIHQADQPVWQINGCLDESVKARQIHLSYHNGEHYNSVRRVGDHSNSPSTILCGKTVSSRPAKSGDERSRSVAEESRAAADSGENGRDCRDRSDEPSGGREEEDDDVENSNCSAAGVFDEMDVLIEEVSNAVGITDRSHIRTLLADHNYDVSAVVQFYTFTALDDVAGGGCGGGGCGGDGDGSGDDTEKGSRESADGDDGSRQAASAKPRLSRPELARSKVKSTKEKRKEKREVKKARQAERNRRRVAGDERDGDDDDDDDVHVLTQEIKCLDL